MADNVKVKGSVSAGAIDVATDDIGGIHHPQYKIEFGADGTATPVDSTNPLPIQLYGSGGALVEVDANGHIGVVAHTHDEGGHIHFKRAIAATQDFILIDLSDTTTYPHANTGWIHTSNMVLGIDASSDANYLVQIGFLENVDGTNGDFHGIFDVSGSKKTGVNQNVSITQAPEAPQMRSSGLLGPVMADQTGFQTDVNLASTADPATVDTPSGNGDVAVRVTITAGDINLSILMGYHTHA